MPTVRAFIAIELPAEVLVQIERLQSRVRQDVPAGLVRWARPEGIHLTLKFLGDVEEQQLPEIERALRGACGVHAPFELSIGDLGCFPNPRRPRVVWVGVQTRGEPLAHLQRGLDKSGRSRSNFEFVSVALLATGETDEQVQAAKEVVRKQLAFYGSTPAYRPTLECHGGGELQP